MSDFNAKDVKEYFIKSVKNYDWKGFISFRNMISPILMKVLYVLGAVILLFLSFSLIMEITENFLTCLIFFIAAEIVWRLICEGAILLFKIHDELVFSNEYLKIIANSKGKE